MRPVQIVERPHIHPGVCVTCGLQSGRDYFVDLGLEISVLYQPLTEGPVYLCSECMTNLINEYYARLSEWNASYNAPAVGDTFTYLESDQQELNFDEQPESRVVTASGVVTSLLSGTLGGITEDNNFTVTVNPESPAEGSPSDFNLAGGSTGDES